MKLKITQENFNRALNSVAKVAARRSSLPVLSNVLLKVANNRLEITATNLDVAITHFVGGKITSEGSITLPARLTQDFVSSLPAGTIDIEQTDNKVNISTEHYESTINGIAAEEFPSTPKITNGKNLTINTKDLKNALGQVILAAGNDSARPVLTGIYFNSTAGQLTLAATDSYRLAEKRLPGETAPDIKLLIPAEAASDLLRIIGDQDGSLEINYNDQQIQFKTSDVELVARLIEGNFPDYQKLIPSKFATTAKVDKNELANIAKVSGLFARESAGSITLKTNKAEKSISIKAVASQLGENTASATADVDNDGEITLNSRYLLDALSVIPGEEVLFCFNGKLEPILIKSADKETDYIHIIMPLKS